MGSEKIYYILIAVLMCIILFLLWKYCKLNKANKDVNDLLRDLAGFYNEAVDESYKYYDSFDKERKLSSLYFNEILRILSYYCLRASYIGESKDEKNKMKYKIVCYPLKTSWEMEFEVPKESNKSIEDILKNDSNVKRILKDELYDELSEKIELIGKNLTEEGKKDA